MGFERREDAERVMGVLGKRLGRFGLTLHPDKTRLLDFRRPAVHQRAGKGPATFDFLGFTFYGANPEGAVDDVVQDSACAPTTGDSVRRRLVPTLSALAGFGAARCAHETPSGALQLLRRQRQLP